MNPSLCPDLEVLIDKVFDAVVPHKQYKVLTADEYVSCQRSVVHVHEMPTKYITPFSDVSYDYKMQAIKASQYPNDENGDFNGFLTVVLRCGLAYLVTADVTNPLWAYTTGSCQYQRNTGPLLHMRAFVATYIAMGLDAFNYEY